MDSINKKLNTIMIYNNLIKHLYNLYKNNNKFL